MSRRTPFAGLLQLEPGESLATENYAVYSNPVIEDAYLQAMVQHRHDGHAAMPGFSADPTSSTAASGGLLTEGQTWYYGTTAIDQYGGETLAVTGSALLPGAISNPSVAPTASAISDGLGTLTAGTYRYAYTVTTASGESLISPVTNVSVQTNGKVLIGFPASGTYRLYRAYGFNPLARVGDTFTASGFLDTGGTSVYCSQQPPNVNTNGSKSCLTVARPSGMPSGAVGWRAYFSLQSDLGDPSLWSPDSGASFTLPTGSAYVVLTDSSQVFSGEPPAVSRTIPGAGLLYAADMVYAGSGRLASGTVESALNALAASGHVDGIGALGGSLIRGNVSVVGSGYTSVTATGSSIIINSSGGVSTVQADGYTAAQGAITVTGQNGIVITQSSGAITISASGLGAASGASYVSSDGSTVMTGPLHVSHGSAGVIVVSSGATSHSIELWKSASDFAAGAPRVALDHDGTNGRIWFSDGQTGLLHQTYMSFGNNQIVFNSAIGTQFVSNISTAGSIFTTGVNGQLNFQSANALINMDRLGGVTTEVYKQQISGDSQPCFTFSGSGQIRWTDGSTSTPMVTLGKQQLGKDTLVVDSQIVGSGGKLVHGRHHRTVSTDVTVGSGDIIIVDNSGGSRIETLPATPKPGAHLTFKCTTTTVTNTLTIARNGNNIEGSAADLVLNAGGLERAVLFWPGDGTGWWRIG